MRPLAFFFLLCTYIVRSQGRINHEHAQARFAESGVSDHHGHEISKHLESNLAVSCSSALTCGILCDTSNCDATLTGSTNVDKNDWVTCSTVITSIAVSSGYTSVDPAAFEACNALTTVTYASTVTSIGEDAFGPAVTTGSILSTNLAFEQAMLPDTCVLTSLTFYGSSIGDSAFTPCPSISSVKLSSNLLRIGTQAFKDLTNLKSIYIPSSVTFIGSGAFETTTGSSILSCLPPLTSSITSITDYKSAIFGDSSLSTCVCSGCATGSNCPGSKGPVAFSLPTDGTSVAAETFISTGACGASTIQYVYFPPTYISIGVNAFAGQTSLYCPTGFHDTATVDPTSFTGCSYAAASGSGYASSCSPIYSNVKLPWGDGSVAASAFAYCLTLTAVTITNGYTAIGASAFYGAVNLVTVKIPNTVTSIGANAFKNCIAITSLALPGALVRIGDSAFQYAYSMTLTGASTSLPASVTYIGTSAFYGCSALATSLVIPEGVVAISDYAFQYAKITSLHLPTSLKSIGTTAFLQFAGADLSGLPAFFRTHVLSTPSLTAVYVNYPSQLVSIGSYAFAEQSGLTSFDFPASLAIIGEKAFYKAGLTSLNLASLTSLTATGAHAFESCTSLATVALPASLSEISENAFYKNHALTAVSFASNSQLTSIGDSAFYECIALTSMPLPNSLLSIGYQAFMGSSALPSIVLPASLTSLGTSAFEECTNLTSVDMLHSGLTAIGTTAFKYSGLNFVALPRTLQLIGGDAFRFSQISYVYIPKLVSDIGSGAFKNTKLECIPACSGVSGGCASAFASSLPDCPTDSYTVTHDTSNDLSAADVPAGCNFWRDSHYNFITSIVVANGFTSIGANTFSACGANLLSVTIPTSVESIDASAFSGCTGLTSFAITTGAPRVPDMHMYGCSLFNKVESFPTDCSTVQKLYVAGIDKTYSPASSARDICRAIRSIIPTSAASTYGLYVDVAPKPFHTTTFSFTSTDYFTVGNDCLNKGTCNRDSGICDCSAQANYGSKCQFPL